MPDKLPEENPVVKTNGVAIEVTPEMANMLRQITEGKKIAGTLAKPLYLAVAALVAIVFGAGKFWQEYSYNATEGSPAFKTFVKQLTDKQAEKDAIQSKINEDQKVIIIQLKTLVEQMDKRLTRLEDRR